MSKLAKISINLLLLTFTFLLLPFNFSLVFAQAPDTLWTKIYGGDSADFAYSIQQTLDGGYVIVGLSRSFGAGSYDVWLLKTNPSGDTIWSKTYGGSNSDGGNAVQQTTDGGYIIAANTGSYGAGNSDGWLLKTDSVGDTTWAITYGGAEDDYCFSVQPTSDGGYFLTGQTQSFCVGSSGDIWLLKTDETGDTLWTKTYGGDTNYEAMGAFGCETFDGGYVVVGNYWVPQGGVYSGWHIKTDSLGDTLWTKLYEEKYLGCVRQTPDSGYILVGGCSDSLLQPYLYLVKTDAQGESLWTKSYLGGVGFSLQLTSDSCYIITGQHDLADCLLIFKTAANGDSLWMRLYGVPGSSCGHAVQQTDDGGYIVGGYISLFGTGGYDFWLLKMEPDVGVEENTTTIVANKEINATIFNGPLLLPENKNCKVFDITGREVDSNRLAPGIYFIEVDGKITKKVIKIQ